VAIFGGVVILKGAGHVGMDLKWAGHARGVSPSHLGSKKFTRWYSVVFSVSPFNIVYCVISPFDVKRAPLYRGASVRDSLLWY
jgi:hypothetical protein